MRTMKTAFRMWLAAFAVTFAAAPTLAQQPKVLKVTMHADVRTLDPFWTTQTIAGIHGLMVFDTLFSSDADLKPQPQMVDTWTVSDDRKVYAFTLRDGLTFHDGSKVTSKDVVASMKRWWQRDGAGKQLFNYTDSLGREGRQDLRVDAQGALRPADRHARQDRHQHPVRDARAGGDGRSLPADQGRRRIRPVRVQARRVGAGQQDRLREVQGLRAAQGAGIGSRRRQGREGRPRRVHLAVRSADGAGGAGRRRDRLPREPAARLPADPRSDARHQARRPIPPWARWASSSSTICIRPSTT